VSNNIHPQINVVRVGVNYHFNFAQPLRSSPNIDRACGNVAASAVEQIDKSPAMWPGFFFARSLPVPRPCCIETFGNVFDRWISFDHAIRTNFARPSSFIRLRI